MAKRKSFLEYVIERFWGKGSRKGHTSMMKRSLQLESLKVREMLAIGIYALQDATEGGQSQNAYADITSVKS